MTTEAGEPMKKNDTKADRELRQQRLGLAWDLESQAKPAPASADTIIEHILPQTSGVAAVMGGDQSMSNKPEPRREEPVAMENQVPDPSSQPQIKLTLSGPTSVAAAPAPQQELSAQEDTVIEERPKLILTKKAENDEVQIAEVALEEPAPEAVVPEPEAVIEEVFDSEDTGESQTIKLAPIARPSMPKTNQMQPQSVEETGDGLGKQLREAREARGLDLAQVAEDTRISADYISALESENFDGLPLAAIYIKSYLKTLARRYGLNPEDLIQQYEESSAANSGKSEAKSAKPAAKVTDKQKAAEPKQAAKKLDAALLRRYSYAMAAVFVLVLAIMGAAFVKAKFFGGPQVTSEDLMVISDQDLEDFVEPELLQFSQLEIPRKQSAADVRQ